MSEAHFCGATLNYCVGSRVPADHCRRRVREKGQRCWQHRRKAPTFTAPK